MNSHEFYQLHLNRVSRSFAHCIEKLEGQLKSWVGLTYLVCRILDTVEDAPWSKGQLQLENFRRFDLLLNSPELHVQLENWHKEFPEGISDGEKQLISASHQIFQDLHRFPQKVKRTIQDMVGSMSAGMQYFAAQKVNGQLRLENIEQVNQYCFFVAGVVGETLTKLIRMEEKDGAHAPSIVDAHHFGLFLQKINILKDQMTDEKSERFFIPSRDAVYASLNKNTAGAFRYLQSLPLEMKSYRLFCASSFYLGLASLPFIEKNAIHDAQEKISRRQTQDLFAWLESHIDQPDDLEHLFEQLLKKTKLNLHSESAKPSVAVATIQPWWMSVYRGELKPQQFVDLGLLPA